MDHLREKLGKPMRQLWIARGLPGIRLQQALDRDADESFHPVYLCMASQYQDDPQSIGSPDYVQGAGDDTETWAHGLTAAAYWRYMNELLECSEDQLPSAICSALSSESELRPPRCLDNGLEKVADYPQISVCAADIDGNRSESLSNLVSSHAQVILCAKGLDLEQIEKLGKRLLYLKCGPGKLGSRDLRVELQKLPGFMESVTSNDRILVCCSTGQDLSIGVVLSLVCLYGNDHGEFKRPSPFIHCQWLTCYRGGLWFLQKRRHRQANDQAQTCQDHFCASFGKSISSDAEHRERLFDEAAKSRTCSLSWSMRRNCCS